MEKQKGFSRGLFPVLKKHAFHSSKLHKISLKMSFAHSTPFQFYRLVLLSLQVTLDPATLLVRNCIVGYIIKMSYFNVNFTLSCVTGLAGSGAASGIGIAAFELTVIRNNINNMLIILLPYL